MDPELGRLRIEPSGGAPSTTVWPVPAAGGAALGEAPAGSCLTVIATGGAGQWLAVPWAGATGWVIRSDTAPVHGQREAVEGAPAIVFDWPIGPTPARGLDAVPPDWYVAVGFAEAYRPAPGRRAIHTGLDLNLRSGGDSDLGEPVYATADGLVTASSVWPVWGSIVLVQHDLPDGRTLWSQYAHLGRRLVRRGQTVARGDQVGTIGKGQGNRFAAHLHFEIRTRDVPASYWPGMDRAAVLANYADPRAVVSGAVPPPTAHSAGTSIGAGAPWRGKGLLVREPWPLLPHHVEAAGRAWRQAALDFVALKAGHLDRPYQASLAPWRAARSSDGRPALWGWSTVGGAAPPRELAIATEAAAALDAAGWVLEPTAAFPPTSVAAFTTALRRALGLRALAVSWRPDVPLALVARFTPWADVLMPWVEGPGALAVVAAQAALLGRPAVPVLPAGSTPEPFAAAFMQQAKASGLTGAALASLDGWRAAYDTPVLAYAGREPWPGERGAADPAALRGTATR